MTSIKQAMVTLIVIVVLAVMIASVVDKLWPILLVGAALFFVYRLVLGGRRL